MYTSSEPLALYLCLFSPQQMVGSRMSAMHVACLSGRHAVVERLIEGRSPKALLNARTKVSGEL